MKTLNSMVLTTTLALAATAIAAAPAHAQEQSSKWLDIEVGKSYIHRETREIARILVSDPEIAQINSLRPGQFQVRGRMVGTTDLWVWYSDDQDRPVVYQVTVHRDLSDFIRRVEQASTTVPPRIYPLGDRLVVEGDVPDVETLERVAEIAGLYDEDFINLMTVTGDHQVQLSVVFAEVSRTGLRELGFSGGMLGAGGLVSMISPAGTAELSSGPNSKPYAVWDGYIDGNPGGIGHGTVSGIQGAVEQVGAGSFNFMGVGSLGGISVFGLLNMLEQTSLTKVLAQPTLVALSGQQAEFLSGGETPLAVSTQDNISIEYRDYGVKLVFVPTVLSGDVVDLRVYAEVSELDDASGVQVGTTSIPGILTRKASSHLRLQSGMTFAMAGMLSETTTYTKQAVPLLGEIPIVGALFRNTSHQRDERELMIFVTPRLVRPLAAGEVPPGPGMTEDNNPNDFEFFLMGLDHRAGSRSAEPTGPIGLER